jgi:hypothetical protein
MKLWFKYYDYKNRILPNGIKVKQLAYDQASKRVLLDIDEQDLLAERTLKHMVASKQYTYVKAKEAKEAKEAKPFSPKTILIKKGA